MTDPRSFSRQQADYNPQVGGLRPQAGPVGNTFIPAPRNTTTDDALKALGTIEPAIEGFLSKKAKVAEEADTQAGREAALQHALSDADAVKEGKIRPNESKYFMKGYKSQYGEVLGQQWALEAKTAWIGSEAKNSDDPNAASQFIQKFTYDKLQTAQGMDPDVRAGLLPHMANVRSSLMTAQADYSAKVVMTKNLENFGTLVSQDVDAFVKAGGKMSVQELVATIKTRDTQNGKLMGVSNEDLNKTVVEAVTNKARQTGSFALLNVLKEYQHIGNNPKYATAVRAAEDAILSRQAAQESLSFTREQRARQERERVGLTGVYDKLIEMKTAGKDVEITPELQAVIKATGVPNAYVAAQSFANTLRTGSERQTIDETNHANLQIINAGPAGLTTLQNLVDSKVVRDINLYNQLKSIATAGLDFTNDRTFLDTTGRVEKYGTMGEFGAAMIDPNARRDAVQTFRIEYAKYIAANPKLDYQGREEFAMKLEKSLTDKLASYKLMPSSGRYDGAIRGMTDDQLYNTPLEPPKGGSKPK